MRILQVISSFPPTNSYGGAPNVAYELSKQLVKRGHHVTVYTTDVYDSKSRLNFKENPAYVDGIKVFRFKNISNKLSYKNFPIAPYMGFKLRKEILNFDIVHLHEYRSFQALLVRYYCKKYGVPYILQAHGSVKRIIEKQRLKKLYDLIFGYRILNNAKHFVAVSKNEIEQYKTMGVKNNQISLISNGFDLNKFKNLPNKGIFRHKIGITDNCKIILYLGRIHKRKGLDFLIKSFYNLSKDKKDVILIIIGPDENFRENLELLTLKLNLSDKIKFFDYTENVSEVYQDADVLVYPAIFEIFGLVPFEAILCDTMVIVTNDCGCGDIIKEANCGYLVEYGDVNDLKIKMKNSLENPVECKKMVNRGKKYIINNLNWDKVVREVERLYENCTYNS